MRKRIFSFIFVLVLMMSLLPGVPVRADSADGFVGSRTVSFEMDSSDVENFYDGGMTALSLKLRMHAPSWLEFDVQNRERSVILTFCVPFTSFRDYQSKMDVLVGSVACILYKQEDGLVLVEDFPTVDLLNFLHKDPQEAQKLKTWVHLRENRLTLNSQTYEGGEKLRIGYDPEQQLHFRDVRVKTWHSENGGLIRSLELFVGYTYAKDPRWQALRERCKSLGQNVEEGYGKTSISLELQAKTHEELASLTAECMDSVVRYKQWATLEGDTLTVQWVERFLLDGKVEEYASIDYVYTLPAAMENAVALSPDTEISEGVLDNRYGQSFIQVQYQTPYVPGTHVPGLDTSDSMTLSVHTDASGAFRRIRRTITLTAPVEQAQGFHEELKAYLSERMVKGTTLEIYDENGIRSYVLSFSSWFWKDIQEFSAPYLRSSIECKDSWIPMGESTFRESFGDILPGFSGVEYVEVDYQFPGDSPVTHDATGATATYHRINPFKTVLEVLGVALVVVVIILCCRRKKPKQPTPEPVPAPRQRLCPQCGMELAEEDVFCPGCGCKLT
jgi:hypothetical protein